jgi:multidrug resistance efflux pump
MIAGRYKRLHKQVPLSLRLRRMARWSFLVPVLIGIPVLLTVLAGQGAGGSRFIGLVEAEAETVGAVGTVRILSIEVEPGQRVRPGDVLVRLDPAGPALDAAVQETRLLDFEQNALRYRQSLQESERRTRQILQEAAVALEAERMSRIRDHAELSALRAEMQRLRPLVEKRVVSQIELSALRPKVAALQQVVARYGPLIAALEARHAQAVDDLAQVRELLAEADKAKPPQAVQAARGEDSAKPDVLRATRAGIVSRIQCQAGDVVVGGQAIIRVTAERSRHVVGMLDPRQIQDVVVGDPVSVFRSVDGRQEPLLALVISIDPEIMDLMDPFNPSPRYPVRGRRVRLRLLDETVGLVPGETVSLRLVRPRSWFWEFWTFGR